MTTWDGRMVTWNGRTLSAAMSPHEMASIKRVLAIVWVGFAIAYAVGASSPSFLSNLRRIWPFLLWVTPAVATLGYTLAAMKEMRRPYLIVDPDSNRYEHRRGIWPFLWLHTGPLSDLAGIGQCERMHGGPHYFTVYAIWSGTFLPRWTNLADCPTAEDAEALITVLTQRLGVPHATKTGA